MLNLRNKTAKEKANLKGIEIAKIKPFKKKRKDFDIEIVDIKAIEGGVEVFIRAWKKGKQIGFGKRGDVDIERFGIFNPPILVDDPNGDIVREWKEEGKIYKRKLREDPQEALFQVIEHNLSVMKNIHGDMNIQKGKRGNTTSTFYPASGTGGDSFDVFLLYSESFASYATVHDSINANSGGDGNRNNLPVILDNMFNNMRLSRNILTFPTDPIGNDSISSAVISLSVERKNGSNTVAVVESNPSSHNQSQMSDFSGAFNVHEDYVASSIAVGSLPAVNSYANFTLDSVGRSWINKRSHTSGTVKYTALGLRYKDEAEDTTSHNVVPPTSESHTGFWSADETGTTKDPKLVVEHTAIPSSSRRLLLMNL